MPSNPVPGDSLGEADNHLNLIKQVLQNQFTSLGSSAVTLTAAEINGAVRTFNGRAPSGGEITPAANDYSLGQLSNVDLTPTSDDDVLIYNSATGNWEASAQSNLDAASPSLGWYRLNDAGISQGTGGVIVFTSPTVTDNTGSLATVSNSSPTGWRVTADADIRVDISWSLLVQPSTTSYQIRRNGTGNVAAFPQNPSNTNVAPACISASTYLPSGQYLNLYSASGIGGYSVGHLSMTVQEVTLA